MTHQFKIPLKYYLLALVLLVHLNSFCMFVVQELSESKSDIYFFTIRERSWVSDFERVASPIFDSSCSPKGALAYNYIFDMQEENPIVTNSTYAKVTDVPKTHLQNLLGDAAYQELNSAIASKEDYLNLVQTLRKIRNTAFNTMQNGVVFNNEDKARYTVLNNVTAALLSSDLSNLIYE